MEESLNGIILLDKKEGVSSTREEIGLKKIFNTRKVGHAGTLDPFATGLIICGINRGTKALTFLEGQDKTYQATLQLGQTTTTEDKTGEVLETEEVKEHTKEEINEVLQSFLGEQEQVPPMFSALKHNGTPLYKLARQHIEIERPARKIYIKKIKLMKFDQEKHTIKFEVEVSKGTYIRTLGVDIAKKLNEKGHLIELRRTAIGIFKVSQATSIDQITTSSLVPIQNVFPHIKQYQVNTLEEKAVVNGATLHLNETDPLLLMMKEDKALALYTLDETLSFYKVLKEF